MVTLYQEVREALHGSTFKPRKRLGQNFLIHEGPLAEILRFLDLSFEDEILEIGPGLGFLTRRLVESARKVWAIEVDPFLVQRLYTSPLGQSPALELIHGDILKVELDAILPDHKVKLVANLPYAISTPVLFRLFESRAHFSLMVLMVQREVAERLAASPGTKSYGSLSVWCQIHGKILDKAFVSPEAFFPRPKVRSTILKLALYPEPIVPAELFPLLRGLVRGAFGQRRKTLSNALAGLFQKQKNEIEGFLTREGIDPRRRGETLSVAEFTRLAQALRKELIADR